MKQTKMLEMLPTLDCLRYDKVQESLAVYIQCLYDFMRKGKKTYDRIALYGAGQYGRGFLRFTHMFNPELYEKIVCVINSGPLEANCINHMPICTLNQARVQYMPDIILITSPQYNNEIYETLQSVEQDGIAVFGFHCIEDDGERIYFHQFGNHRLSSSGMYSDHINRYMFARSFCRDKDILDIACGAGYGTNLLSGWATSAIGADIDPDAIMYAQHHFQEDNIVFENADASAFSFDKQFDVIISFETLEHLAGDTLNGYLGSIRKHLKGDGIFIASTPYVLKNGKSRSNPHHLNELNVVSLRTMLHTIFEHVDLFIQDMATGAIGLMHFFDLSAYKEYDLTVIAVCG